MKKIVVLDAKTLGLVPNLKKISEFGKVITYETTSPNETISRVVDADIIIANKVVIDKDVLIQCKKLQLICISATGMNNVDLELAKELGIVVKNAVGYGSNSVAQHTIALILQLFNQLSYYDAYVKSGKYPESDIFTHYGPPTTELHNKVFGIIGLGNIGRTVAKIVSAFGAKVNYHSTSGNNIHGEYPHVSLNELLRRSDIISIHAPLNDKTQNLISDKQLSLMKSTATLVNVGRGGIVNESALAMAINNNQIGGACIDVFEKEPIHKNNPLLHVAHPEKIVLSPHSAWASIEARTKLVDIVYENIKNFLIKGD